MVHEPPFAQIYELPDGGIQMYLRDPGGNLIEVDHPDATTVDRNVVTDVKRLVDTHPAGRREPARDALPGAARRRSAGRRLEARRGRIRIIAPDIHP